MAFMAGQQYAKRPTPPVVALEHVQHGLSSAKPWNIPPKEKNAGHALLLSLKKCVLCRYAKLLEDSKRPYLCTEYGTASLTASALVWDIEQMKKVMYTKASFRRMTGRRKD
jgi:hypothetical protein